MYEEPGLKLWIYNVLGQLSFHIENDYAITPERIKHLQEVFACLLFVLGEKGMDHLDTWIPPEMEDEIKFAESFGFQQTGIMKTLQYDDGRTPEFIELRINF